MKRFLRRFRRAFWGLYCDGCLGYAKGAAYSALLAFFPALATLSAFLILANAAEVSQQITIFLFHVVPPGAETLLQNFAERGSRPVTLPILASLLALYGASGVMISLIEGFQAVTKKPDPRGIVRKRLVAVLLIFVAVVPVVGASSLMLFGERLQRLILNQLGLLPKGEQLRGGIYFLAQAGQYLLSFATTALVTALLYYFGPTPRRPWRTLWPGALLATVLWLVVTLGFAWYVRNLAGYNVLYGSIGTAIALLVWMYLLAAIALLGFEFNTKAER